MLGYALLALAVAVVGLGAFVVYGKIQIEAKKRQERRFAAAREQTERARRAEVEQRDRAQTAIQALIRKNGG